MMLSRVGPPPHQRPGFQVGGGRQAPWGWIAGAPYRGTASPPLPVCVCVCVCVCRPVATPRPHQGSGDTNTRV